MMNILKKVSACNGVIDPITPFSKIARAIAKVSAGAALIAGAAACGATGPATLQPESPTSIAATSTAVPLVPSPSRTPALPRLHVSPDIQRDLREQRGLNADGSLKSAAKYVESSSVFSVAPETISHIKTTDTELNDIIAGINGQGQRVFWNKEVQAWVPEFGIGADYQTSPLVPLNAYYDGSAHYSAAVFIQEHPGMIPATAPRPFYFANMINTWGVEISLVPINRVSFPEGNYSQVGYKYDKPFAYLGFQQTRDKANNVIYVIVKDNANPTDQDPSATLPTFHAFDKAVLDDFMQYDLIKNFLSNKKISTPGQTVPMFLPPPGYPSRSSADQRYYRQLPNPHVAALLSQSDIGIFPANIQAAIIAMYAHAGEKFDAVNNSKTVPLGQLPPGISDRLLFTGLEGWR